MDFSYAINIRCVAWANDFRMDQWFWMNFLVCQKKKRSVNKNLLLAVASEETKKNYFHLFSQSCSVNNTIERPWIWFYCVSKQTRIKLKNIKKLHQTTNNNTIYSPYESRIQKKEAKIFFLIFEYNHFLWLIHDSYIKIYHLGNAMS